MSVAELLQPLRTLLVPHVDAGCRPITLSLGGKTSARTFVLPSVYQKLNDLQIKCSRMRVCVACVAVPPRAQPAPVQVQ